MFPTGRGPGNLSSIARTYICICICIHVCLHPCFTITVRRVAPDTATSLHPAAVIPTAMPLPQPTQHSPTSHNIPRDEKQDLTNKRARSIRPLKKRTNLATEQATREKLYTGNQGISRDQKSREWKPVGDLGICPGIKSQVKGLRSQRYIRHPRIKIKAPGARKLPRRPHPRPTAAGRA